MKINRLITWISVRFAFNNWMALNAEETIKNLQEAIKKDDHNEVYEYSKILLKESPQDSEYQQCFIISSLKINLTDELSSMFKSLPTQPSHQKLYAYFLYHTGQIPKCVDYVRGLKSSAEYQLLLAQCHFKQNSDVRSAQIMRELLQNGKMSHEDREMYLVNLFASGVNTVVNSELLNSYANVLNENLCREVYYNYALLLIERGDYESGCQCLSLFENQLKKGEDEVDIQTVRVLKDYIGYKSARAEENAKATVEVYEKMEEETTDLNLKAVIKNNLLFVKGNHIENFHEALRNLQETMDKKTKSTRDQQFVARMNKLTIFTRKNKFQEALKALRELQSEHSRDFLMQHIVFVKNKYFLIKKNHTEESEIKSFLSEAEKYNPALSFCLMADLQREQGSERELINEIKNSSLEPIIKNYIFSLLIKNPDLFEQYHQYLEELLQKTTDLKILQILLKLYESKKNLPKQQTVLQKILKIDHKNSQAKVKMGEILLSQGNIEEAEEILRGIEEPQEIKDASYLQYIEKNIHVSIKKDDHEQPAENQKGKDKVLTDKKRIKKNRRPRYPKNMEKFVEGFKPDPQRWLPKWQRKGYKKKNKKGVGKTQGLATVGKEETKNVFASKASTSTQEVTKKAQKKRR